MKGLTDEKNVYERIWLRKVEKTFFNTIQIIVSAKTNVFKLCLNDSVW